MSFKDKATAFLGQLTKMSVIEWILFAGVMILFFFVLAHPIKTIVIFVAVWFLSLPFRNFIKGVIAKWKS